MRVYAHILTWNDLRYLPDLFESLESQTHQDLIVRVVDNGSTDGTLEYLQTHHPRAIVGRNVRNQGFAGGHNQLFQFTFDHHGDDAPEAFVMILNADMILDEHVTERLAQILASDETLAATSPKIYRAFGEHVGDEVLEHTVKSDILDSAGLRLHKGWRMTERGAGEIDKGQYDNQVDIFGPSGAMAMFRMSALHDVALGGEWFDGDFFAYREDCDLAWRLRRAGWSTQFVPDAKSYHYRGMYGAEKLSLLQRIRNRRNQSTFFAALSTRNQLCMLVKNLSFSDALLHAPWLLFHELGRVVYGLLFESRTRKELLSMSPMFMRMLRKRGGLREKDRAPRSDIRSYAS